MDGSDGVDHGGPHHGGDGFHGGDHTAHGATLTTHGSFNHGVHFSFGHHWPGMHINNLICPEAVDPQGGRINFDVPTMRDGEVVRGFIISISRHGELDIMSEFRKLALRFDLIPLDRIRPSLEMVDKTKFKILDRKAWQQAQAEENHQIKTVASQEHERPLGWYPNAKGTTRLRRQHWQVGKRPHELGIFGTPQFDPLAHTYFEIESTDRAYYEACDYATDFEIRIVSLLELDNVTGQWGFRRDPFDLHQQVAIKIYHLLLLLLLNTRPSEVGVRMRQMIDQRFPPIWEEEGARAETPEEAKEAEFSRIDEIARDDQIATDNQAPNATGSSDGSDSSDNPDVDSRLAELTVELDDE